LVPADVNSKCLTLLGLAVSNTATVYAACEVMAVKSRDAKKAIFCIDDFFIFA
jgi:hypothetical protein